jgi:polysaccharide biosynthesis/export protein
MFRTTKIPVGLVECLRSAGRKEARLDGTKRAGVPMFRRIPAGVFGLVLLALPSNARQGSVPAPATQASPAGAEKAAPKPATGDPNYVIGPQDILDVSVWKEPEISRAVPVRPDGKISLPLLNDVQAAGLTPAQLITQIATGLSKFMTNPEVTVIVTGINSQRFYILGEVTRAGGYVLLPGMTVLQAVSNAGGLTQFTNGKKIYVLRPENGKQTKLYFNYKDALQGKHEEQNIVLKAGDTVVVP